MELNGLISVGLIPLFAMVLAKAVTHGYVEVLCTLWCH